MNDIDSPAAKQAPQARYEAQSEDGFIPHWPLQMFATGGLYGPHHGPARGHDERAVTIGNQRCTDIQGALLDTAAAQRRQHLQHVYGNSGHRCRICPAWWSDNRQVLIARVISC